MERLDSTLAHRSSAVPDAAEATRRAGVQSRAPAPAPGRLAELAARARDNVWMPVVAKGFGILLLMSGLGGIGAASTLAEAGQLPLEIDILRKVVELENAPARPASSLPARAASSEPNRAPSREPARASASAVVPVPDAGAPRSPALTADGKVILNLATVDDLRNLPGIGPKRAEKIVALRDKLKRFRRFTDLLRVKGIGPKRLKQLLPKLVLDPPPPAAADAGLDAARSQ